MRKYIITAAAFVLAFAAAAFAEENDTQPDNTAQISQVVQAAVL